MDQVKKIRLLKPDGSLLLELTEAETKKLVAKAEAAGCSPYEYIGRQLKKLHDITFSEN